ncbi:MAG: sulfatase-like hydrolase/transferase, partial [Chitinivibrionales bacterium]|nr:sulfatase-like hydrolase/transferase [Chitinivibrionales bacterium]
TDNYLDPGTMNRDGSSWTKDPGDTDFHLTDALTDYAVDFINEKAGVQPFFLYLSHPAPHFSGEGLIGQARPDDYQPFSDTYTVGYDTIRQARFERLKQKGIVPTDMALPDYSDSGAPPWDSLDSSKKTHTAEEMANHAGLVAGVDRSVQRVLETLQSNGIEDTTMVMFLSDNGASGEENLDALHPGWANTCCCPFRYYKTYLHEGGISTPLLVQWPAVIGPGAVSDRVGHVMDITATCIDVAGVEYPSPYNGDAMPPLQGVSLYPSLKAEPDPGHAVLCWEFHGKKAVRSGKWKIVQAAGSNTWHLYDIENDRGETADLSSAHLQRTQEMSELYDCWLNNDHDTGPCSGLVGTVPRRARPATSKGAGLVFPVNGNRFTIPYRLRGRLEAVELFDADGACVTTIDMYRKNDRSVFIPGHLAGNTIRFARCIVR